MKQLKNEQGIVLIVVIMLMAVVALIGIMAINTSTVDVQIYGNLRRASTAFGGAEAGTDLSVPIIEQTVVDGEIPAVLDPFSVEGSAVDIADDLAQEIAGSQDYDPDGTDFTVPSLNGVQVDVDIDRLYSYTIPGGSLEAASGYEGTAQSAAGGGVGVLFRINSRGTR